MRALLRHHADTLYGVAVFAVVAGTSAAAALVAATGGAAPGLEALAGVIALPLGAWYAGHVARPVVTRLVRPSPAWLPRLARNGAVPRAWRTLVVIPAIVATPQRARELLARLAGLAREHNDPNVRFALLADFADAPTRNTDVDAEILDEQRRLVQHINAELRDESGDRVFVLQRERRWHSADRVWMGWERKRGKIVELHRLLLGRSDTSFRWTLGDLNRQLEAGEFPYVFTLDETNWLASGEVLSLLRVAAHPENRARFDAGTGRLVHGYAIFQPSVVAVSATAHATHGGAVRAPAARGHNGVATRFYFNVLGVGVFFGKGLLDVRACHALLDDVFPPGVVLQHDVLEGFVARTAEVRDAFVIEPLVPSYMSQIQRGHRWLRGYFQLLPWVLPRVRGGNGAPRANPLRPIHRLFILELVHLELARPASLVLLVAGWLALPSHSAAVWTVLVCPPLAVLLARPGAAALAAIVEAVHRGLRRTPRPGRGPRRRRSFGVDTLATVFSQAMLPYESLVVADALCRATWRMLVSRRRLLDWPPVARLHPATRPREPREYRRVLRACYLTGLFTLVAVAALRPLNLLIALPFVVAWISAPTLVSWLDSILAEPEP